MHFASPNLEHLINLRFIGAVIIAAPFVLIGCVVAAPFILAGVLHKRASRCLRKRK